MLMLLAIAGWSLFVIVVGLVGALYWVGSNPHRQARFLNGLRRAAPHIVKAAGRAGGVTGYIAALLIAIVLVGAALAIGAEIAGVPWSWSLLRREMAATGCFMVLGLAVEKTWQFAKLVASRRRSAGHLAKTKG